MHVVVRSSAKNLSNNGRNLWDRRASVKSHFDHVVHHVTGHDELCFKKGYLTTIILIKTCLFLVESVTPQPRRAKTAEVVVRCAHTSGALVDKL